MEWFEISDFTIRDSESQKMYHLKIQIEIFKIGLNKLEWYFSVSSLLRLFLLYKW